MRIETQRLILRHFTMDDQVDFNALIREKMASPMARYDHEFPTDDEGLRETLAFFVSDEAFIAVEHRATKALIGFVTLHPTEEANVREIGYCIHAPFQRQGFAAEAVTALIGYARAAGVKTLVCGTAKCNEASVSLLKKLSFSLTAEGMTAFTVDESGKPVNPFVACMFEKKI